MAVRISSRTSFIRSSSSFIEVLQMFFDQMMHIMAGPYLGSLIDWYCENQDVWNTLVVIGGAAWLFYKNHSGTGRQMEFEKKG